MPLFSKTSLETVGFSVKRRKKSFLVKNSLMYTFKASEPLLLKKTTTQQTSMELLNPRMGGEVPGRKGVELWEQPPGVGLGMLNTSDN